MSDAVNGPDVLSNRVGRVAPSATLRISGEAKAMRARGIDVIDLSDSSW